MIKRDALALLPSEIVKIQNYLAEKKEYEFLDIFNLLLYTGVRASEFNDIVDLIRSNRHYGIIDTKGGVKRHIYVPIEKINRIENINYLDRKQLGYLFIKITKIVNINRNITPHDMRASAITMLNNLGFSPFDIQAWTAHKKIDMVGKYIRRNPLKLQDMTNVLVNFDLNKLNDNLYTRENVKILLLENERLRSQIKKLKGGE